MGVISGAKDEFKMTKRKGKREKKMRKSEILLSAIVITVSVSH